MNAEIARLKHEVAEQPANNKRLVIAKGAVEVDNARLRVALQDSTERNREPVIVGRKRRN